MESHVVFLHASCYSRQTSHILTHWGKCIFLNENIIISINISLKFVPKSPINNILALVQIMAWRRPGAKPLSESMMVILPTRHSASMINTISEMLPRHAFNRCSTRHSSQLTIAATHVFTILHYPAIVIAVPKSTPLPVSGWNFEFILCQCRYVDGGMIHTCTILLYIYIHIYIFLISEMQYNALLLTCTLTVFRVMQMSNSNKNWRQHC